MNTNTYDCRCGKCHSEKFTVLPDPNAGVAWDLLDLRGIVAPLEPIVLCDDCGHVAPRGLFAKPVPTELREMPWNDILSMPMPDLARHYLNSAPLYDLREEIGSIGLACIQAAWCCEDTGHTDTALQLRNHAGIFLLAPHFENDILNRMFTLSGCECARLTGSFKHTPKFIFDRLGCSAVELWRTACRHNRKRTTGDFIEDFSLHFLYHIYLCQIGDCSPHRLSDIPKDIFTRFAELNGFDASVELAKIEEE